jgi:hypothetical protein
MSSRHIFMRASIRAGALAVGAMLAASVNAARADDGPILVFPLSSAQAEVTAAQAVTQLVAQRMRFVYGEQVKLVPDLGSESLSAIVKRTGAKSYVGGSLEKTGQGYSVDIQARDGATNALRGEQRVTFVTTDAVPKELAVTSLLENNAALVGNARFVLVPFEADASTAGTDTFLKMTQDDLVKRLSAKGITTALVAAMDPVDARIGAPDLCKDNNATGVLVGRSFHKQSYQQGALKGGAQGLEKVLEIVPIAGPIVAGVVNATTNAVAGAGGSDDRYQSRAEVDLTLLNCDGKRVWSGTGIGETKHSTDHNVANGDIGAIDLAVSSIVDTMVARR